jgi:KaiC/GvpD/RAD55 family RecA-like ATPase
MYDLSAVLDVDALKSVAPGASILITGPAMTGKEELMKQILADGAADGDGAIAMTTGGRAEDVIADIESRSDAIEPSGLCGIDCRAESNREQAELDSGAYVHRVAAPSDMTGIGVAVTDCFDRLHDAGFERGRLGLTNLSTMITYADQQTVFKFCHVLSSRLDPADFLGTFTIDSSAHDQQTLQVIKQTFDGVIEIEEREGVRKARVMGVEPDPSEWVEL